MRYDTVGAVLVGTEEHGLRGVLRTRSGGAVGRSERAVPRSHYRFGSSVRA